MLKLPVPNLCLADLLAGAAGEKVRSVSFVLDGDACDSRLAWGSLQGKSVPAREKEPFHLR